MRSYVGIICTPFGEVPLDALPKDMADKVMHAQRRLHPRHRGACPFDMRFKTSREAMGILDMVSDLMQAEWENSRNTDPYKVMAALRGE